MATINQNSEDSIWVIGEPDIKELGGSIAKPYILEDNSIRMGELRKTSSTGRLYCRDSGGIENFVIGYLKKVPCTKFKGVGTSTYIIKEEPAPLPIVDIPF